MHHTLEQVINGEQDILQHYAKAVELWDDLLSDSPSMEELAELATRRQFQFEQKCGGRRLGQEVMAVAGIARYYSTMDGFGGRIRDAMLVYDALRASYCSLEVKVRADEVAESYHLLEEHGLYEGGRR